MDWGASGWFYLLSMRKLMIEKYIQFGVDNGFKFECENNEVWIQGVKLYSDTKFPNLWVIWNLYEIITSKIFIEAIARGLFYNTNYRNTQSEWRVDFYQLVRDQAEHICDWTLDDFIKEILDETF